ncbi:MAG: hypothetical protein FD146_1554 [Anaerolineaceae bacterium]|nr:MAG: hypothetical protein FD146_1554 [Anaerolineaceae bacterium]
MSLLAAVGQARALDGRETGLQATHQALNALGSAAPILGVVIASYQYEAQQVINGVASLTGNMPLIGFSAPAGMTSAGLHPHSVVVALLAATDARAEVQWLAGYTQGSREVSQQLADLLKRKPKQPSILFVDGFNADAEQLCASLPAGVNLVGALSSGDLHSGNAYQIGGTQSGAGGLALARLEGQIRVGVGTGHGWQPVGTHFRVTRSRGFWVRTLDGRPASESYARLFGYPAREWAFPPLNHLARLYPLGLEQSDHALQVRSPLRIEADGSFRMNAAVSDGSDAYLLTGSLSACQAAAKEAVQQAQAALEGARPVLALVLTDVAWQMLFEAQPGADIAAVQEALGPGVPLAGGYTLGQIVPGGKGVPQFLNQHMVVILIGEPEEKQK